LSERAFSNESAPSDAPGADEARRRAAWTRGLAAYYRDRDRALQYGRRFEETHTQRVADRAERRAVRKLLAKTRGAAASGCRWIDIPSGAGRFASVLDELGAAVVAADVSVEMLAHVDRSRVRGRVCASAFELPFADGAFDGALCLRFLQHFEHPSDRRCLLRELRRIVRGPVVLSYFDAGSLPAWRRRVRARRRGRPTGRFALTRRELDEDLGEVGYRIAGRRHRARFVSEWTCVLLDRVGIESR